MKKNELLNAELKRRAIPDAVFALVIVFISLFAPLLHYALYGNVGLALLIALMGLTSVLFLISVDLILIVKMMLMRLDRGL